MILPLIHPIWPVKIHKDAMAFCHCILYDYDTPQKRYGTPRCNSRVQWYSSGAAWQEVVGGAVESAAIVIDVA